VSDPDYFPTATRPAVTDPEWLVSLEEVRAYGASDSTVRTAEQLEIGLFYIEAVSPKHESPGARAGCAGAGGDQPRGCVEAATGPRSSFAALNIAQADTYIRTWRVKYPRALLRPYTAINSLYPGTNWTPARQTPCHPEFYAAHGTLTPPASPRIQNYRAPMPLT